MSTNATGANAIAAVNKVSHERMEDLIREAIQAKLNDPECDLRLQEFDLAMRKEVGQPVLLDLTVYGMAGDTTKDDFCVGGQVVRGGGSIQVTLDDDTTVKFAFKDVVNLNATDYLVTYQLA